MTEELEPSKTTLAERASSLDISPAALHELSSQVLDLVTDYFSQVANRQVFPQTGGGETVGRLNSNLPSEGESLAKLIEECRVMIDGSRHNGHPRFFGYVASPSTPVGALADLIASTLNPSVTSWRSAPAATEVELMVVRWLGSLITYGENARGLLTSGGSMANLIAILTAQRRMAGRTASRQGLWHSGLPMTIYASDQVHLSIPKAADVLGIGRDQVHIIESDDRNRMNVGNLRRRIEEDLGTAQRPFCLVANAGTVNTGAVDPLNQIADLAEEFGLWFHIDGAYGAPAVLDPRKRSLFAGLERADSVSLDPHKWLYTPVDCGCLLFRDDAAARAAFMAGEADYIKVHEQVDEESFAFWDYGLELSRRFRALKVWFTFRYYGTRRLAQAISDDISLAEYLGQLVDGAEDFELMAPVELSICCFRYSPPTLKATQSSDSVGDLERVLDELNARIMHAVQRGGRAYLSNATVRGRFALRVCITNFRTTRTDIEETLKVVRETARELQNREP